MVEEEEIDGFGDVAHGRHEPLDTVSPRRHGVFSRQSRSESQRGRASERGNLIHREKKIEGGERETHTERKRARAKMGRGRDLSSKSRSLVSIGICPGNFCFASPLPARQALSARLLVPQKRARGSGGES